MRLMPEQWCSSHLFESDEKLSLLHNKPHKHFTVSGWAFHHQNKPQKAPEAVNLPNED
jgi:hypothetical protein